MTSRPAVSFLLLILSLVLAGCHTVKPPSTPEDIWTPPQWEKTSKAPDKVWTAVREKEITSTNDLNLIDLIDIALRNNPTTRSTWQDARAAKAGVTQAKSKWYPQIKFSAKGGKNQTASHPHLNDVNEADIGLGAKATWLLLDFGGRGASIDEAVQTLLSANFLFNQAVQDLLLDVSTAYYQHYSALSLVDAAESDVEDARTALEAAQQKLKVGLGAQLDVLQTDSTYQDSLYNLEDSRGKVKNKKADLAQALGYPADIPLQVSSPSDKIPTEITGEDISQLIEEAMKARPDVSAEKANLRAKEKAARAALSDLFPELNANGDMSTTWSRYYRSNVKNEHDYEYSGYISVDWDVFDGFNNWGKYRQAKALAKAERMKLMDTEISASADVWKKYYDFKTAIRKLKFSRAFSASAQESYNLALESYKAGIKSILDLLDSQSQLSKARSQLIQSKEDAFLALAQLAHATGSIYARRDTITSISKGK